MQPDHIVDKFLAERKRASVVFHECAGVIPARNYCNTSSRQPSVSEIVTESPPVAVRTSGHVEPEHRYTAAVQHRMTRC